MTLPLYQAAAVMDPLGTLVTLSLSRRKSVALSVQGYLAHKKTL